MLIINVYAWFNFEDFLKLNTATICAHFSCRVSYGFTNYNHFSTRIHIVYRFSIFLMVHQTKNHLDITVYTIAYCSTYNYIKKIVTFAEITFFFYF